MFKYQQLAEGQSATGWRPERVLLQVWKAKAWSDSPHPLWLSHSTAINTIPSLPPTVSQPVLKICEDDVSKVFRRQTIRKAKGPDGVSPACLKACAVQLSIFTMIFNRSLERCEVPSCFKRSTIIPVPKKPKITGLNVYRPVALTSVVMKSFERLVLAHLKDFTGPLLDPLQFAYRANRSVDDAVNMGLHYILQHLDKPGTYARILFVDFSSTFNTISQELKWDTHIDSIVKKAQQRLFFLRQLKKFNLPQAHIRHSFTLLLLSQFCAPL